MKKVIALLLAAALCFAALAGCSQSASQDSAALSSRPSQGADTPDVPTAPVTVTVWHDGDEGIMQTIAGQVNAQLADNQVTVVFEKKTDMPNQLKLYGSDAANAPDMYFYAHDVLGTFVAMDILAPLSDVVDTSILADHLPMTVEAGQVGGTQYLLPVYFETLVLLYNKALWEGDIPGTTEGLYDYMAAHTDAAAGTYAVVNQHTGAYNVSPFIYGFGGYIINEDGRPGLNDPKTIEAAEYNRKFGALQADGDYNTVTTLFNEGKAAAIIGGPWLVSGIVAAGIDYGVASLSDIKLPNGNGLAPFSGIQGVGVLKTALAEKEDAVAREQSGLTTAQYITNLLIEYYEMKENGGKQIMAANGTRTMAFQIPEDLFQRIKTAISASALSLPMSFAKSLDTSSSTPR